ncbi:hypothetical protein RHGRI_007508 [Rhododendron griersonianum]|uniref:SWIM-type domain-containing protein n=1 Tax=Rhododendron griersonianum TaxID=479676 RepID=A0AAV6KXV1_9ERIC|nr:hypothetical protein RHGRI_007508 [Rhododendron griersonianum]
MAALLERWRPETHSFHLRTGECTVTLQDMEVLVGVPIDGEPVIGTTNEDWVPLCRRLLGIVPEPKVERKGGKVMMTWLRQHFQGHLAEGYTDENVQQQARGYILQLIGGVLMPDHSGSQVHLAYLTLLEDLTIVRSWGSACLSNLYHFLCHGCQIGKENMGGVFILLQLWAWKRFPFIAPGRLGRRQPPPGSPLGSRWDDRFRSPDLATHVVGYYRNYFDMQRPDEVSYPSIVQEQFPGESSQPQHYDNETTFGDFVGQCSQYHYNYDTTSLQGQNSAEFPFHDTTFRRSASQVHNELIEEEHEGLDEETDEGSESSLEDVDAALEADGFEDDYIDGRGNVIPALKPPCPMYTQDTWSNIIDPSTPMPTRSHLGWDGRSELFEGQLFSSKDELQCAMKKFCMTRNYVVKTDKSSPNLLSYKCNNKTSCGWRLRASIKPNSDMWKVTKYTGPHSCLAVNVTQDHSMLDARYMANEMTKIIGSNFSTKIKTLQLFIKKLTEGYMPSYSKTWAAKQHSGVMSWREDDSAYNWRPPHAYHRYYLRHLGSNYHRRFGKLVGKEVKVCAMECQKKKFKAKLTRLKRFANERIYEELNLLNKKQWTFAYDGGRRYGSETTNCSKSFNGVVKEARHLPIMATVMFTFYKCVEYFDDRLVKSMDTKAKGNHFSLYAKKKYDHWRENAVGHDVIVFNRAAGLFEVHTPINRTSPYKGNNKHTVDLTNKTCTCNKIQLWKIPCSHVIAVCNKMHIDPLDYFGKYWTVDTTIAMYGSLSFKPLPD